jgi:hypothetical protein
MVANLVHAKLKCPRCDATSVAEIEAEIDGLGFAQSYRLGDRVDWRPGEERSRTDMQVRGYVECGECGRDYFVQVVIKDGLVAEVALDPSVAGYIQ